MINQIKTDEIRINLVKSLKFSLKTEQFVFFFRCLGNLVSIVFINHTCIIHQFYKIIISIRIHIRSIKRRLIAKQITDFACKLRDESISLINLSLANIYCSTTLSNHGVIRLKRFISRFTCKLCNWFFSSTFNASYMCPNI